MQYYWMVQPQFHKHMTQEFLLWKRQISQAIVGLCNIEFHQSGGPGAKTDGTSFREAMNRLYADSHFAHFVSYHAWRQAGLNDAVGAELLLLQQQLDSFDEPEDDAAIQHDPYWASIIEQAQKVVGYLGGGA